MIFHVVKIWDLFYLTFILGFIFRRKHLDLKITKFEFLNTINYDKNTAWKSIHGKLVRKFGFCEPSDWSSIICWTKMYSMFLTGFKSIESSSKFLKSLISGAIAQFLCRRLVVRSWQTTCSKVTKRERKTLWISVQPSISRHEIIYVQYSHLFYLYY